MKRCAMAWTVAVGGVVMLVAGFVHTVLGFMAGVVCAEAMYLWRVVRSERIPTGTGRVASGTE